MPHDNNSAYAKQWKAVGYYDAGITCYVKEETYSDHVRFECTKCKEWDVIGYSASNCFCTVNVRCDPNKYCSKCFLEMCEVEREIPFRTLTDFYPVARYIVICARKLKPGTAKNARNTLNDK